MVPEILEGQSLSHASALSATWWEMVQRRSSDTLNTQRDARYAARIRGALARLREEYGSNATLMVPIVQSWRTSILEQLEVVESEEVSCLDSTSREEEE